MRKIMVAALLALSIAPAFSQAPPPVPALPDTERRTAYTATAQTGPFNVNFQIYGDSTDYIDWVQVWVNGIQLTTGWTLTSPTGAVGSIPRPITNAQITFAVAQTGTIQIVGARRPRRLSQFQQGAGVAARDLNVAITDLVAQSREQWDLLESRVIQGVPGETLSVLPAAATRANKLLGFDGNGDVTIYATGSGGGGGSGVSQINCTTPITCTPNPITGIGAVSIAASGVVAGSYGTASQTVSLTIDTYGRITVATANAIAPAWSSITGTPTTLTGYGITSPLNVAQGGSGGSTFTANAPILGNGTAAMQAGGRSGNTTTFATVSGSFINGHCPQADASGNLVDSGAACSSSTSIVVTSVTTFGATGNCSTDDTAAVQSAIASASAAGGTGIVYFPPVQAAGCYKITKLNASGKNGLTFLGNGSQSQLKVTGKDTSNNWLDLSCSNNIVMRNLSIVNDGVSIPDNIILWGWCGSVYLSGLIIDHVDMDVNFVKSGLYAFGYTGGAQFATEGNSATVSRGLHIKDSTWYGRYATGNGGQTDPSLRSALLHLHGRNNLGVASANQVLGGNGLSWSTLLVNVNLIDAPAGFGAGARDNNAALVCMACGAQLTMQGGSLQCLCETPFVGWYFTEGVHLSGIRIGASDQSTTTLIYAFRFGGPAGAESTGEVTLEHFFLAGSINAAGGVIAQENPGAVGGPNQAVMGRFRVIDPDIGGATVPMLTVSGLACTLPQTPISNWIGIESHIDMGGLRSIVCGSIDFSAVLVNPGAITNSNPGTQLTGCQFRIATPMACGTSTTGGP